MRLILTSDWYKFFKMYKKFKKWLTEEHVSVIILSVLTRELTYAIVA